MVLNKMKNVKGQSGFTIVELLIVIVVIGILAAITIVAYSGITARANTVKAQSNAESAQKVAETYNADLGLYPTMAQLTGYTTGSAQLPSGITLQATAPAIGNGLTTLSYVPKGTTGGCIGWFNFTAGVPWYTAVGNAVVPAGSLSCS